MEPVNIKTLDDIVRKVPAERLDYFLTDLKGWVAVLKLSRMADPDCTHEGMDWVDDGKHSVKVQIHQEVKKK